LFQCAGTRGDRGLPLILSGRISYFFWCVLSTLELNIRQWIFLPKNQKKKRKIRKIIIIIIIKEPEREELRPSFVPILDADALNGF
jgi:hypothetical protein